jgi:hypothetical protein
MWPKVRTLASLTLYNSGAFDRAMAMDAGDSRFRVHSCCSSVLISMTRGLG